MNSHRIQTALQQQRDVSFVRNVSLEETTEERKAKVEAPFSREFREIGAKDSDLRQLSAISRNSDKNQ